MNQTWSLLIPNLSQKPFIASGSALIISLHCLYLSIHHEPLWSHFRQLLIFLAKKTNAEVRVSLHPSLFISAGETLIHAFILYRIDYWNSLLSSILSSTVLNKLQTIHPVLCCTPDHLLLSPHCTAPSPHHFSQPPVLWCQTLRVARVYHSDKPFFLAASFSLELSPQRHLH